MARNSGNALARENGVSEVIGAVMLIVVVVAAVSLIGVFLFSQPQPEKLPALEAVISNTGDTVQILHNGGDALQYSDFRVMIDGQVVELPSGPDTVWSSGETLTFEAPGARTVQIVYTRDGAATTAVMTSANFGGVSNSSTSMNIMAGAGAGGSISPSGAVPVVYGGSQTFSIAPNAGYRITDVVVDGDSVGAVSTYTFSMVTRSHAIYAAFAKNPVITASAGPNGAISPSGEVSVTYGSTQNFTITPDYGYRVLEVVVDGNPQGAFTEYTFSNVEMDHSISATFIETPVITASASSGGSISPSGLVSVMYGSDQPFVITPNLGYNLLDVEVDSVSVGSVANYTFTNVVANHTIAATFAITQYSIEATAGANGAISPSGITVVNYGGSQAYNITPDTNYQVSDVVVDSVSVGPVTNYTFTNVVANHTIAATFSLTPPVADFTATPLTGGVPLTVTFTDLSTNNPTSWLWNFGDPVNTTSVEKNPTHIYSLPGNYSVELWATNDGGTGYVEKQGYIFTYYPAVANFTAEPTTGSYGLSGLTVQFSDHSTGGVSSWDWDFGDGSYSEYNTHQNPGHTYDIGVYSVNLSVANTFSSDYLLRTNYINVTPNAPTSDFETYDNEVDMNPLDSGAAPLSVFFYDLSSDDPTSWTWDFDDGNVTTITKDLSHPYGDIYHTFTSPGTYNVSFTATNAWGSDTSYKTITVTGLTITASSGSNGAVTPSGETTVNYGATPTYTITPDVGYHVADVLVNGTSVGAVTSYTFPPVTTNMTISATFAINTYTITASSGANGAITPTGVTTVNYGDSQAYTITPVIKYHIDTLTVDGVTTTYPPKINSPYTFTNVQENHTISVTFAKNLREEIFFDTFDPLAPASNGWSVVSSPDWQTSAPVNGTRSIRFRGSTSAGPDEAIYRSVPTTGYSEINVSYLLGARSLDSSSEYFAAQYSTNAGGSYTDITRITGPYGGSYTFTPYTSGAIPTTADNQASNFWIRFGIWASATNDYGWIDDVKVTGIPDYI